MGRTKRHLQDRLAEHRYAGKVRNYDYAMVKHFKDVHNDTLTSFTALGIDHVPLTARRGDRQKMLNQKEGRWIHRLNAMCSPGLNDNIEMIAFL